MAESALAMAPQTKTSTGLSIRHGRPLLTREMLVEEGEQRQLLMAYVKAHMVTDVDFGVIPGTKNLTLLKPGAEKLTELFRCVANFEIDARTVEDFDKPLFHYVVTCRIVSRETGEVVAEGMGSANSREKKYRYRNDERKCPACGAPAIKRSKFPPRGAPHGSQPGWYCYGKIGGCGAQFDDANDPGIVGQTVGMSENLDVADAANTLLKMAKKRAHVDGVIALARCSDMFTQDADDFDLTNGKAAPATVAQDEPVQDAEVVQPVDPQELKDLLKVKGWANWPACVANINKNEKSSYPESVKPSDMAPLHVRNFFDWLKTKPDYVPKTKPTTDAKPAEPGSVFTMLSKSLAQCVHNEDITRWELLYKQNESKLSADEKARIRDELTMSLADVDAKAEAVRRGEKP